MRYLGEYNPCSKHDFTDMRLAPPTFMVLDNEMQGKQYKKLKHINCIKYISVVCDE